ncbi:hypothetical protein [Streptomyces chumphonensis]|uniref:hypothetical protein n=1 Tax=Streptomyces chumphonensis TaxID=1214925 RepID=UPI003D755733
MTELLLVQSDDPAHSPGGERFVEDALHLAAAGHRTSLFLVDNAVFAALPGALPRVADFLGAGGHVLVDAFSAQQRSLTPDDLLAQARTVEMDDLAARLLDPQTKVVWH